MSRILISTGALIGRPNGRDYKLIVPFSKNLSCDGYEFMMYSDWYEKVDTIVDYLKSNNISVATYHCQKSIGEGISKGTPLDMEDAFLRFNINVKMASDLGAQKMVLHLWDGITSDQNIENNLKAYGKLRNIADEYGMILCIENVVCNQKDPLTHWQELYERYPDVSFVFDTKMAAFHDQLKDTYNSKWLVSGNHIKHYHVNDYGGGYMDWANLKTLPIGKGHIDFEEFFAFIDSIGYDDTFTLESTAFNSEGTVDFDMLNREIEFLKAHTQNKSDDK